MKHQEIILTPEEKLQQTRQIEAFLKKNYSKLVRVANKKLRRYSITHVEAEDLVGNLYPILDRLAFVHKGWAGEEDVLKQSCARRLSNLLSGNFSESGSCLLAFPLDVGLRV